MAKGLSNAKSVSGLSAELRIQGAARPLRTEQPRREPPGDTLPAQQNSIRIAVIDRDAETHALVQRVLVHPGRGWTFDSFTCFDSAVLALPNVRPSLILVGIDDPTFSTARLHRLRDAAPDAATVALVRELSPSLTLSLVIAGASGCLLKPLASERLVQAVERALEGWPAFCPKGERAIVEALHRAGGRMTSAGLTARESEVMVGLASGHTVKDIARELNIATNTAHVHIVRAYEKLGAHTVREAVEIFLG